MGSQVEVRVPDIGDFDSVPIIEVLVSAGDRVAAEDPLITLESDKATMDVPSPQGGLVAEVKVSVGDSVAEGTVILVLEQDEEADTEAAGGTDDTPAPAADPPAAAPAAPAPAAQAAAAAAPAASAGTVVEVTVPDIGDFTDVPVIEVLVAPGQSVAVEEPLVTLESDKATMDVPSPVAGIVEAVLVAVGDTLSAGAPIATVRGAVSAAAPTAGGDDAAPEPAPAATPAPSTAQPPSRPGASAPDPRAPAGRPSPTAAIADNAPTGRSPSHATPGVRRFARELGVEIAEVTGTGRKGRILREDVTRHVKATLARVREAPATGGGAGIPPVPAVDFSRFGEIETRPLSRIKRISGPHLQRSWLNVPHVTHHDEADITDLEAFRKATKTDAEAAGVRVTPLAYIVKALAAAMQEYPNFNSSLAGDGENLILKKYCNIGVAVDTPGGLVVPVVRDVPGKGIFAIAGELAEFGLRAREGKLKADDMQGGCMTISSLGGIGGTAFTPIVNAPEVAILGVTRSRMAPVWNGEAFAPRLMLPLDLSYDHRVIDGAEAARFVAHLGGILGDVRRLIL